MEPERYEITKLLGKGRTGGVYLAQDTHTEDIVAMRRFFYQHPGDDSAWTEAFKTLNPVALHLTFPNTLPIKHAAIDQDGPYIITPYLEHSTKLSTQISKGEKPSIQELQTITTQLLEALQAIHQAGYTHAALSPNSILITKSENKINSATLTDWATYQIAESLSQITKKQTPLREPALTAPEILQGQAPSPQSDIYSLGHILFALWNTGHPHGHLTEQQILKQIESGNTIDVRKIQTPLPPALSTWLHKAMHPNPEQRIQNATQALKTFPASIQKNKTQTPKPAALSATTPSITTPPAKRPKSKTPILIALTAIILIGGAIAAIITIQKPTPEPVKTTKQSTPPTTPKAPPVIQKSKPKPTPTPTPTPPTKPKLTTNKTPTPPKIIVKPIEITPKPTPTPKTTPQPITKGNYTFQVPNIFTTDYQNLNRETLTIPLDHKKQYAWAILNNTELQKTLKGGANSQLSKIISIQQIGNFTPIKITQPQALYTVAKIEPTPETFYAHGRRSKALPNQGWKITIKIPNLGTEPLHIGIDTRSALTKTNYSISSSHDKVTKYFTLTPPEESIKALPRGPYLCTFHNRQTITIQEPTPNSTITIDVTIGDTYAQGTNSKDLYSLGLNAITIWRN